MTRNPTTVHKIIRFAVEILPGSPAAVMNMIPPITNRTGAATIARLNSQSDILSTTWLTVVAVSGFGNTAAYIGIAADIPIPIRVTASIALFINIKEVNAPNYFIVLFSKTCAMEISTEIPTCRQQRLPYHPLPDA